MDAPSEPGKKLGLEERLARAEEQLASFDPKGTKSPVQHALKYLPLLAVSNFLFAVPAFLLSVAVAWFTFVGAEATKRMQIASVWPHVAYETTNLSDEGKRLIRLSLTNKGVGPANIKGMEIRYRGYAYTGFREILGACCSGDSDSLSVGLGMASIVGEVLSPGDNLMFAQLDPAKVPPHVASRFEKERLKLSVRVCYCSVFDDCWIADGDTSKTRAVKSCPADWTQYNGSSDLGLVRK